MRCGKPEHQPGQKCTTKNAKCKDCHKIGHFYKIFQSKKRDKRANLVQVPPQAEQDTYYNPRAKQDTYFNECGLSDSNPLNQPNPPMVNMLKIVNHIGATSGSQETYLKIPIDINPRGPYKHHIVVRVDTGADVNCMNEKTFKKHFPEVKLSVCPHDIQNFGNSFADISILGQFHTYLQFRGEKYLNTFVVTNANDCPNLLSHGATFRMGVLLPNYSEENVVKSACGENVPNFKYSTSAGTSTGTSSNVFQILQDLWLKQYQENHPDSLQNESRPSHTSTTNMTNTTGQPTPFRTYRSTTANERMTGTLIHNANVSQSTTSFRTTTPTRAMTGRTNTFRTTPNTRPHIPHDTSCNGHLECCMHVHQPTSQVCKLGESLALRKVNHPLNGKTSVSRLPLTKQDILSQYSGCFEGIGHFPGNPYKFHLKPDHKPARHAPRKVPVHLKTAFKEEIESLVKQGILEEVKEHTDKEKIRMRLDPRDLNEALERDSYYTHSTGEITTKFPSRDRMEHARHFPTSMKMCMDDHLTLTIEKTQ